MSLEELKIFWFANPQLWFNCTKEEDILITNKFGELLSFKFDIIDKKDYLSYILLNDQISRHVYREDKTKIKYNDEIAFKYCSLLLDDIEEYLPEERCFILMPLRHTFKEENLLLCLSYINRWNKISSHQSIYDRFYKATITILSKIKTNNDTLYNEQFFCFDRIYDSESCKVEDFVLNIDNIMNSELYKEFIKYLKCENKLIVSISGGVDSMVCSLLAYVYCLHNNIKLFAIGIDYDNRKEQYLELEMVSNWLNKFNIEFHVRKITELNRINRSEIHREFYEKVTREIRFDMYKKLDAPVILGHNKDDSLENIFSNIIKKKNYNNLLGMTHQSIDKSEKDVIILRPLLNVYKKDILAFAKKFNIPFTYDSTPKWSERGKMRDILIPQIKKFNPEIINGLYDLCNNFAEIYKIYEKSFPNIIVNFNEIIVEDVENYFFDYWKNIFIKMKLIVKNKAIEYFIENIKFGNRITLNKILIAIKKDKYIHFFIKSER